VGSVVIDLDLNAFAEWISIPPDELVDRSPIPLTILPTAEDVHRHFAQSMYAEILQAFEAERPISIIIPLGPKEQFPMLADMVNQGGVALDHVTFFGMDEWLDWQGRPLPWEHPNRLEAYFYRHFLDLVDAELRPPAENVIFPSPYTLDRSAEELARRGRVSTTYAGFGFQGHVAFNESPSSRWTPVTLEQLRESSTRVVSIRVDSIIAHAERSLGGNVFAIPPMAVTLGMRELLSAERVRLYSVTGAWKQTILRILLFARATVDYPVTLVSEHPDVAVIVDRATAACPPTQW
jgi:glucosamine-6-phosphate deaminase